MIGATAAVVAANAAANAARIANGGQVREAPGWLVLVVLAGMVGVVLWVLWDRWRG